MTLHFGAEQGGFGVPVANILFAPYTPAFVLPVASCDGLFSRKAIALGLLQQHYGSNPPVVL